MKSYLPVILLLLFISNGIQGQTDSYSDSLNRFREQYITGHELIKGKERGGLDFFPVSKQYCIKVKFEKVPEAPWFGMETSGTLKKNYRVYGTFTFKISDTILTLNIYQSKDLMATAQYAKHLFIPFTDKTSGNESYENGRYIDFTTDEVEQPGFMLDFNKAYNPYCAYVSNVYNCPLPPPENDLPVAIRAGEKKYRKAH